MLRNASQILQVFTARNGTIPVPPGMVISPRMVPEAVGHPAFVPALTFKDFLDKNPTASLGIVRSYALGDIIMLYSLVRSSWKKIWPKSRITFYVQRRFLATFDNPDIPFHPLEKVAHFRNIHHNHDVIYDMNGIVEIDHTTGKHSQRHRVLMFAEVLGLEKQFRCS